jgi:hypothetical protein
MGRAGKSTAWILASLVVLALLAHGCYGLIRNRMACNPFRLRVTDRYECCAPRRAGSGARSYAMTVKDC